MDSCYEPADNMLVRNTTGTKPLSVMCSYTSRMSLALSNVGNILKKYELTFYKGKKYFKINTFQFTAVTNDSITIFLLIKSRP